MKEEFQLSLDFQLKAFGNKLDSFLLFLKEEKYDLQKKEINKMKAATTKNAEKECTDADSNK